MKDLPPEKIEGSHWDDAGMGRRLKSFRTTNTDDSGETVKDFFTDIIGYQNVLPVDASKENSTQLSSMSELIE
jgi:hypothetical protein